MWQDGLLVSGDSRNAGIYAKGRKTYQITHVAELCLKDIVVRVPELAEALDDVRVRRFAMEPLEDPELPLHLLTLALAKLLRRTWDLLPDQLIAVVPQNNVDLGVEALHERADVDEAPLVRVAARNRGRGMECNGLRRPRGLTAARVRSGRRGQRRTGGPATEAVPATVVHAGQPHRAGTDDAHHRHAALVEGVEGGRTRGRAPLEKAAGGAGVTHYCVVDLFCCLSFVV